MIDIVKSIKDGSLPDKEHSGSPKGGRPKVPYLEHWEEMYQQWKEGSMSAGKFQKSPDKKGMFCHMIIDYKDAAVQMRKRRRIE